MRTDGSSHSKVQSSRHLTASCSGRQGRQAGSRKYNDTCSEGNHYQQASRFPNPKLRIFSNSSSIDRSERHSFGCRWIICAGSRSQSIGSSWPCNLLHPVLTL
ncbi:hypothetical protein KC362_g57 [Hortaea werneckii]|nr:hypothetical protein KC362_g57 [Hortaea werneckii]